MNKTLSFLTLITTSFLLASCAHLQQQPMMKTMPVAHNSIKVKIQNGTAISPSNASAQTYQPVNFDLANDECKKIALNLANSETFPLQACYKGNILSLDTKTKPATRFYYSPLWQQGFTYPNMTSSDSRLRNVDVRIKVVSAK